MFEQLRNTHNLVSLPAWGPYTKKYIGISHIPDMQQGIRFDLSVFPGLYRRRVDIPNVHFESGYYPWEASGDLTYFSFRHELEWKDLVYTDISYSWLSERARLIRANCVNNTDIPQNIVLHLMASLHFPSLKEYAPDDPIFPGTVDLPASGYWIDALDYDEIQFATPRVDDNLVYDGKLRGEQRKNGFVHGSALAADFGQDAGDTVTYTLPVKRDYAEAVLVIRYRMTAGDAIKFQVSGTLQTILTLTGNGECTTTLLPLGRLASGASSLTFSSLGGAPLELDGMALVEAAEQEQVQFHQMKWQPVPEILDGPTANSLMLKYGDIDTYYGIRWEFEDFKVRQFFCRDLDIYFRRMANEHVQTVFHGEGDGHYTNVFLRPITIAPQTSRQIYATVCSGTRDEVERALSEFQPSPKSCKSIYTSARKRAVDFASTPAGEPYRFSQERMAATTLCNVVYPIYTQRSYILHNTPGRWWDCLYTWDSGFIGLGFLELEQQRAIECLNTYLTEPGVQSAFLHHGSPVPVQHYLFLDLWNRTQSRELLEYCYPRLRQYHQFMAGRLGSSSTRSLPSNLLRTWDYFYNSGGWDDYPPQVHVRHNKLEDTVTPVITTAQVIRTAKILKMAALELGEDVAEYDRDIEEFTHALQTYAWDEDSGYFGYVCHDSRNGSPKGILRHESGTNFDMGFDGAYPLISGICTPSQETRLVQALMSDAHLWSDCGLSAVDQSAPYYRIDGYWNGTVWMSHQWFFWKTLFDLNQLESAWKVAKTALDVWKGEVDTSYHCMEHFLIATRRGVGWHEFGGLSAPVLSWFGAYYIPGHLTTGLDTWVTRQQWNEEKSELTADLTWYGTPNAGRTGLLVCLHPDYSYQAAWNNTPVEAHLRLPGVLEISLPGEDRTGTLTIRRTMK